MKEIISANEIREIIKEFTKMSPKDDECFDISYVQYLAKCKLLYSIDKQLSSIDDEGNDELYEAMMTDITRKVKNLVKGYIEL